MAKVKYVGDPQHNGEGPNETTARGYKFVKGKETDVPDSDTEAVRRFKLNGHFEVSEDSVTEPVKRGPGRPPNPTAPNPTSTPSSVIVPSTNPPPFGT